MIATGDSQACAVCSIENRSFFCSFFLGSSPSSVWQISDFECILNGGKNLFSKLVLECGPQSHAHKRSLGRPLFSNVHGNHHTLCATIEIDFCPTPSDLGCAHKINHCATNRFVAFIVCACISCDDEIKTHCRANGAQSLAAAAATE